MIKSIEGKIHKVDDGGPKDGHWHICLTIEPEERPATKRAAFSEQDRKDMQMMKAMTDQLSGLFDKAAEQERRRDRPWEAPDGEG